VLGDALRKHRSITLERTLGNVRVEAKTLELPPSWEKEFGIQMRVEYLGFIWLQTFDNVDEARRMEKEVFEIARDIIPRQAAG
jgi:hypothetical protein